MLPYVLALVLLVLTGSSLAHRAWETHQEREAARRAVRAREEPRAVFVSRLAGSADPRARQFAALLAQEPHGAGESYVTLEARFREYLIATRGTRPSVTRGVRPPNDLPGQ